MPVSTGIQEGASVILRSRATKNPKAIERLLRIHPDKRDSQAVHGIGESWVDKPERWVIGGLGFFTAFRMTEGGAAVVCRDYSAAAILSQWNRASPKRAWFTLALLWYRWMSISLVKDIPPWHWCARYVTLP